MNDYEQRRAAQEQRALTMVEPLRMTLPQEAVREHQMTQSRWRALTESIFPSAKSVTGILMALDYCKARNLDVMKRPVHVVPMWNSALGREVETVWPGIGELRTTASRTGSYAGMDAIELGPLKKQGFAETKQIPGRQGKQPRTVAASCDEFEFPAWAQATVYRIVQGHRVPFVGPRVFFIETFSGEKGLRVPNARWRQAPMQMLQKCAEAAALRAAFPEELGNVFAAEEMDGKIATSDIPQADYQAADAGDERGGGATLQREEPEEPQEQNDRDHPAWGEEALKRYMTNMRHHLERVTSISKLESMLKFERDTISTLPDAERREAEQLETDARSRIETAANEKAHRQHQRQTEQQQDDEDPADGGVDDGDAVDLTAGDTTTSFVDDLRARVAKAELIVDLNSIENETFDEVEALPDDQRAACAKLLQERRNELRGVKK